MHRFFFPIMRYYSSIQTERNVFISNSNQLEPNHPRTHIHTSEPNKCTPAMIQSDTTESSSAETSAKLVQDILILFQTIPGLDAQVSAWSRYEASKGTVIEDLADEDEPPYQNALEAMRDGWQVIQISELKHRTESDAYIDGPLPYHVVLSKFNPIQQ